MKPQTKETAILMLVDSIEAASRTIDPPDRERFEMMIQRIIFTKLKTGQLDESGLTVEDLRTLVTRMTETLVNMHHHRIKYQWQAQQAEEFGVPSQVARETASGPHAAPPPRGPLSSSAPDSVSIAEKNEPADGPAAAPDIQVKESLLPAGASLAPSGEPRRSGAPEK
jgi:hypothetical protein